MGGSIRFVTTRPEKNVFDASAQVSLGSFGLRKYLVKTTLQQNDDNIKMGLARITGDGYRQNSDFFRNSLLLAGKTGKKNPFNYLLSFSDVHAQTPSSIDAETFAVSPALAAANWYAVEGYEKYNRLLGGIRSELALNNNWQTMHVRGSYTIVATNELDIQCNASVNNVLNEQYASMLLINAPSFGGNEPRYFYPGMPRNFVFTAKVLLK